MKSPWNLLLVLPVIAGLAGILQAQPDEAFTAGMKEVANAFVAKAQTGAATEADYAEEFARLDAFFEANATDPEAAVEVLSFKAIVYAEILNDYDQAITLIEEIAVEYPLSKTAASSEEMIAYFNQQKAANLVQQQLVPGAVFPEFSVDDMHGGPLALADYRGKVVLVDFWATWCMPCIHELPNVKAAYDLYHDEGFEIIGISLDKDQETLARFVDKEGMPWPQYFDGKVWSNELSRKYSINSIPATFLLDQEGKIIARDLRGPALGKAVAAALEN